MTAIDYFMVLSAIYLAPIVPKHVGIVLGIFHLLVAVAIGILV